MKNGTTVAFDAIAESITEIIVGISTNISIVGNVLTGFVIKALRVFILVTLQVEFQKFSLM